MEKFSTLTGKAMPLRMANVDTDLIIPANFLTSISKKGYGKNLFRRLRDENPDFVFNQERYKDARILIAEDNFGCGSSREHAVWALMDWGIRVVISSSFADIFANNSGKNGLVLVVLSEDKVAKLIDQAESGELSLSVDLERQLVSMDGAEHTFDYDPYVKHCLLNGLDEVEYIQSHQEAIDKYNQNRKRWG